MTDKYKLIGFDRAPQYQETVDQAVRGSTLREGIIVYSYRAFEEATRKNNLEWPFAVVDVNPTFMSTIARAVAVYRSLGEVYRVVDMNTARLAESLSKRSSIK